MRIGKSLRPFGDEMEIMRKKGDEMKVFEIKPYRLINKIQHYAWGTKNEQAFIPKLLSRHPEPNVPYAELWMGSHPNAPSEVETAQGRQSLIEFISAHPVEILGRRVARQFFNQLPFLFKVLSAGEVLSIQAHPNKEQAVALHQRDPKHYPDANHKPEIAIALDHLVALAGFCSEKEIKETLHRYSEIRTFIGDAPVDRFLKSSGEKKNEAFKDLFTVLMEKGEDKPQSLENASAALQSRLQAKKILQSIRVVRAY